MVFFATALGLLLHICFWGAGLAWLASPRVWKRFWPLFIGIAGIALQSGVVWIGAHTNLKGTLVYAWPAQLHPLILLAVAWWRHGTGGWKAWFRLAGLLLLMVVVLGGMMVPFAAASKFLTTFSLGSCDAADYAAGARVLTEFAHGDRSGFIGLTEVVRVHSVDNFFDYWLRLNHFTPSAVLALNGAVFGLEAYQLVSVSAAVFLVLGIPIVFWVARAGFRYRSGASLLLAVIYGVSPLMWYAVAHASMSQLLAAPAIALINLGAVATWRAGASWRRLRSMMGLLALGFWLILGAYNFIVVVCCVPALFYAGGQAVWFGASRKFLRWLAGWLAPLVLVSMCAPARITGLLERFLLFREYDFGWKIPALSPEGWYGLVGTTTLDAYGGAVRWILSAVLMLALLPAFIVGAKRRQAQVFMAICFSVPILLAYAFLLIRGETHSTNASYDAYKLLAVFYPGLLAALCFGLFRLRRTGAVHRAIAVGLGAGVLAGNLHGAVRFAVRLENPPLLVDLTLPKLKAIESVPEVNSINMKIADFWERIWANVFLLHRPQYFPTHTYEGRLNTELKGEWDLMGGLVSVRLPDDPKGLELGKPYSLVKNSSPFFLKARFGEGWYDMERIPRHNVMWRWTKGDAELIIDNPQSHPLNVAFRFEVRSVVNRDLEIWVNGRRLRRVPIGTSLAWVRVPTITVEPGSTVVRLRSNLPPRQASASDTRLLGFAAYGIEVDVKTTPDPMDD